jgi:putative addiction module component (TIGR02574 family)
MDRPAHYGPVVLPPPRRKISVVTPAAKKVLEAALALPTDEREEIIRALSISLEPATSSPEWQSEITRRLEKIENAKATSHDAEAHLQTLRAKHGA